MSRHDDGEESRERFPPRGCLPVLFVLLCAGGVHGIVKRQLPWSLGRQTRDLVLHGTEALIASAALFTFAAACVVQFGPAFPHREIVVRVILTVAIILTFAAPLWY